MVPVLDQATALDLCQLLDVVCANSSCSLATPMTSQLIHSLTQLLALCSNRQWQTDAIAKQVIDVVQIHCHVVVQH